MSNRYIPSPVPTDPENISAYLQEELKRISQTVNNISEGHWDVVHVAPEKPREGDVRFADGTDWNPGSNGVGPYVYKNGGWCQFDTTS